MSQQINLFNPAFRKQIRHFSLLTMLQGLGIVVIGCLFLYGYATYQVVQLGKILEETNRRYLAEQGRLAASIVAFSPKQSNQSLQDEVRRMEKLLADQSELVDTVKSGAIGNTTGYSEYMRAFARQITPGLWLTGFRMSGDATQISLNGAAVDPGLLPAYIQRLSRESIMHGKTFSTLQMQQAKVDVGQARYVEFKLHSSPDSGARK